MAGFSFKKLFHTKSSKAQNQSQKPSPSRSLRSILKTRSSVFQTATKPSSEVTFAPVATVTRKAVPDEDNKPDQQKRVEDAPLSNIRSLSNPDQTENNVQGTGSVRNSPAPVANITARSNLLDEILSRHDKPYREAHNSIGREINAIIGPVIERGHPIGRSRKIRGKLSKTADNVAFNIKAISEDSSPQSSRASKQSSPHSTPDTSMISDSGSENTTIATTPSPPRHVQGPDPAKLQKVRDLIAKQNKDRGDAQAAVLERIKALEHDVRETIQRQEQTKNENALSQVQEFNANLQAQLDSLRSEHETSKQVSSKLRRKDVLKIEYLEGQLLAADKIGADLKETVAREIAAQAAENSRHVTSETSLQDKIRSLLSEKKLLEKSNHEARREVDRRNKALGVARETNADLNSQVVQLSKQVDETLASNVVMLNMLGEDVQEIVNPGKDEKRDSLLAARLGNSDDGMDVAAAPIEQLSENGDNSQSPDNIPSHADAPSHDGAQSKNSAPIIQEDVHTETQAPTTVPGYGGTGHVTYEMSDDVTKELRAELKATRSANVFLLHCFKLSDKYEDPVALGKALSELRKMEARRIADLDWLRVFAREPSVHSKMGLVISRLADSEAARDQLEQDIKAYTYELFDEVNENGAIVRRGARSKAAQDDDGIVRGGNGAKDVARIGHVSLLSLMVDALDGSYLRRQNSLAQEVQDLNRLIDNETAIWEEAVRVRYNPALDDAKNLPTQREREIAFKRAEEQMAFEMHDIPGYMREKQDLRLVLFTQSRYLDAAQKKVEKLVQKEYTRKIEEQVQRGIEEGVARNIEKEVDKAVKQAIAKERQRVNEKTQAEERKRSLIQRTQALQQRRSKFVPMFFDPVNQHSTPQSQPAHTYSDQGQDLLQTGAFVGKGDADSSFAFSSAEFTFGVSSQTTPAAEQTDSPVPPSFDFRPSANRGDSQLDHVEDQAGFGPESSSVGSSSASSDPQADIDAAYHAGQPGFRSQDTAPFEDMGLPAGTSRRSRNRGGAPKRAKRPKAADWDDLLDGLGRSERIH